jgi:hypothetical protein
MFSRLERDVDLEKVVCLPSPLWDGKSRTFGIRDLQVVLVDGQDNMRMRDELVCVVL